MRTNAADSAKVVWLGEGDDLVITPGTAVSGFQSIPASLDGRQVGYLIEHTTTGIFERENGLGVWDATAGTLSRDTVTFSTAGGSTKVDFSAGTKHVTIVLLATQLRGFEGLEVTTSHRTGISPTEAPFDIVSADHHDTTLRFKTTVAGTHTIRLVHANLIDHDFMGVMKDTLTAGVVLQLLGDDTTDEEVTLRINGADVLSGTQGDETELYGAATIEYDASNRIAYIFGDVGEGIDFRGRAVSGNGLRNVLRGGGGSPTQQVTTLDCGKYITTEGSILIPNEAVGDGWFHATLEFGANTHDLTFNGGTLDISVEGFIAGEIYEVIVKSATAIRVIGPQGIFTEADF